eukprot:CAMPEP_0206148318 /NCGR_PEP_ID=MMETSP1473-20131121/36272_1 /ASSEMBLY_ACC=CAM_ASM_001109 /TAXON_ID=1461547 /ORGANISM="Stichococcus sp, Strain RCC1054" /LENGTH=309 /DNA_ID=CAMNT_0053545613 /DNA_START=219 /DNA_END=1148 /DNA_ORIENTATION=-
MASSLKSIFADPAMSAPLSSEEAAALTARNASAWSAGSGKYREMMDTNHGAQVMGVILDRFVELGVAGLEGIDAPRCLDIASGPGEPALSIAAALPHATVTATDLAEGMVQIARERAQEQGLSNVKAEVADGGSLSAFSDESVDLLTANMGIIFFADASKALKEWHRVMKPGGRIIYSVWGGPDVTDMAGCFGSVMRAVAPGERPMVNPHALAVSGSLGTITEQAGFSNVHFSELNCPMRLESVEATTAAITGNPVITDVLDKVKLRNPKVYQEAKEEAVKYVKEKGFVQEDGSVLFPTNMAIIVTATA